MRHKDLILQAYTLTVRNLRFWLFGLVLFGGFNLYLINFFSLLPNGEWKIWPFIFAAMFGSTLVGYLAAILAGAALFVVINLIKIIFIVVAHNAIHKASEQTCDLCVRSNSQSLPYLGWLSKVLLASGLTIAITSGITLATNAIISNHGYDKPTVVIINLIFITIVACIVGTWNLFTSYFVVMHGMKFAASASSAIDLLVSRPRRVLEFLVILSVLYTLAVLIGNAFIDVWHNGFAGTDVLQVRLLALLVFVLWFAVNNAFFNLAMIIFFDKLVRAIGVRKEAVDGQLQPNVVN